MYSNMAAAPNSDNSLQLHIQDYVQKNICLPANPIQVNSSGIAPYFIQPPQIGPFCQSQIGASPVPVNSQQENALVQGNSIKAPEPGPTSSAAVSLTSITSSSVHVQQPTGGRLLQPKTPILFSAPTKISKAPEKPTIVPCVRVNKNFSHVNVGSAGSHQNHASLVGVMTPVNPAVPVPGPSTPQLVRPPMFVVDHTLLQGCTNESGNGSSFNEQVSPSLLLSNKMAINPAKILPRTQVVKVSPSMIKKREVKPKKAVTAKVTKFDSNTTTNLVLVSRSGNAVQNGFSCKPLSVNEPSRKIIHKAVKATTSESVVSSSITMEKTVAITQIAGFSGSESTQVRTSKAPSDVHVPADAPSSFLSNQEKLKLETFSKAKLFPVDGCKKKETETPLSNVTTTNMFSAHQPRMQSILPLSLQPPQVNSSEEEGPDLLCHDSPLRALPSPPPHSALAENCTSWKKARLLPDSGATFQSNQSGLQDSSTEPPSSPSKQPTSSETENHVEDGLKNTRRARKPRVIKATSVRTIRTKKLKSNPVVTTTKTIPITLELRHNENVEQRKDRLSRLAQKWSTVDEDHLQWLVAAKSAGQLKMIRWLRLADRAFAKAESARNFEKMERLRDSKIHVIMDLEKLQAPFEPRAMHFMHTLDLEKKNHLINKFRSGETLLKKDVAWLKVFYGKLCDMESTLPNLGACVGSSSEPKAVMPLNQNSVTTPLGNEGGHFLSDTLMPSTSTANLTSYRPSAKRKFMDEEPPNLDLAAVQAAHQFVRKFPDSTKAMIELGPDDMACAVLLLIQQPNAKTVQVKKEVTPPPSGFRTKQDSIKVATELLDHLVVKYLCIPSYPIYVRYPVSPSTVNEHITNVELSWDASRWNFDRRIRGWETVQFVDSIDLNQMIRDQDFDLANDRMHPRSQLSSRQTLAQQNVAGPSLCFAKCSQQITSRQPLDLTSMANDPVGQRQWLSWECRHLTEQYFNLDACSQAQDAWLKSAMERIDGYRLPDTSKAIAYRFADLSREGLKKVKMSTTFVNKTIKTGEQVRDILESYKKKRPMTRRKAKAIKLDA